RSTGTALESSSRHTLLDHPLHHPQQGPTLGGQHGRRGIGNVLLLPTVPRPDSVSPSELPQHLPLHILLSRVLTTSCRLFDLARRNPLRGHVQHVEHGRHDTSGHAHRPVCPRTLRAAVRQLNDSAIWPPSPHHSSERAGQQLAPLCVIIRNTDTALGGRPLRPNCQSMDNLAGLHIHDDQPHGLETGVDTQHQRPHRPPTTLRACRLSTRSRMRSSSAMYSSSDIATQRSICSMAALTCAGVIADRGGPSWL